jgi:hypothetical protein
MMNNVFTVEMADDEPDRHEHGGEAEAHAQHDARLVEELLAEHVPGACRCDTEGSRYVCSEQHVGKSNPEHWT